MRVSAARELKNTEKNGSAFPAYCLLYKKLKLRTSPLRRSSNYLSKHVSPDPKNTLVKTY